MNMKAAISTILFFFLLSSISAQDGATLFKQNCAACHKTGGGRMVGPDLTGVSSKRSEEWLIKWTKSSAALIASGDADAKAIFEEFQKIPMNEFPNLSDADIKAIYAFVATWGGGATSASTDTTKKAAPVDASVTATADRIELGRKLFEGSVFFINKGPACISCHNVNYKDVIPGGLLAKDLTNCWSRLGGDAGLSGMLGAPPFPAMTQAYKDRALTEFEISALSAFLYKVDKDVANHEAKTSDILLFGGIAGMIGLLVVIFGLWFVRKKDNTKKDIYNRQVKSI